MKNKRYKLDDVKAVADNGGRAIVAKFRADCCSELAPREGGTRAVELHLAFLQWCMDHGYPGIGFWRWSQHFSTLVARLANRQNGTRYRVTNDYGGIPFTEAVTASSTTVEKAPEQWAREQGMWIIEDSPGWQSITPEWVRAMEVEGRLQAPAARLCLIHGGVKVNAVGSFIEIANGLPAADVIIDALAAVGWTATLVGAPVADEKPKRTA